MINGHISAFSIVLPQLITCFAILNTFSYNSYQIRYTVLIFTLIVMGLGIIIPGTFPVLAMRGHGELPSKSFKE